MCILNLKDLPVSGLTQLELTNGITAFLGLTTGNVTKQRLTRISLIPEIYKVFPDTAAKRLDSCGVDSLVEYTCLPSSGADIVIASLLTSLLASLLASLLTSLPTDLLPLFRTYNREHICIRALE
ncbi:hypothetical protein YC2023_041225 [Brassica napus]